MADSIKQFDKYSRLVSENHIVPIGAYLPFSASAYPGTGVWYNALATKTDLRPLPVSASAAGAATAITSALAATDEFTLASHGYQNGQVLQVSAAVTMPGGFSVSTDYYVVSRAANTFKLAASLDGPPIDITLDGNTVSVTIPAGQPWYALNVPRSSGILVPYPMSVAIGLNDDDGAGVSIAGYIDGEDLWGDYYRYTFSGVVDATAVATYTVHQSSRAYAKVWRIAITAAATTAAADILHCGVHGGDESAIATVPRPRLAIPIRKPTAGCVKVLATATERTMSPTVNTTYGTVALSDAATADLTAANMAGAVMILDPDAVL